MTVLSLSNRAAICSLLSHTHSTQGGKALYLNKGKIQDLIDKQRSNLAEVEYLDLDSVAKIIDNFGNPINDGEERFRIREKEAPVKAGNGYKEFVFSSILQSSKV